MLAINIKVTALVLGRAFQTEFCDRMSPARKHNDVDTAKPPVAPWEIAVVGRYGKPPLRFKGQRHAHMRRQLSAHDALCIELWARRKGGFVLAYSDVSTVAPKSDALVLERLSEAVDHLEALCANQSSLNRYLDLPVALSQVLQTLGRQQQFSILVGDFLAAIDAVNARVPTFPPTKEV
ncbi:hypothetical protein [Yoonia algicola]|uniref:Uncharacterized protein n=1 Tax=Yoonia algicola TaxID=3137368 RepID=A0AAN0NHV5_9RHOB